MTDTDTILITGASGKLGRGVVRELIETNAIPPERVIAATREPGKLTEFAERGVAVRRADFNDAGALKEAFAGASSILIISTDEFDLVSGKRPRQHKAAIDAARVAGARHVAYTSMLNPEPGSPFLFADEHYSTEQAIKASGLTYTIFRNNAYHENLFMSLAPIIASGRWYTSAGQGRTAYAARDDMAAAIAGRLAAGSKQSAIFDLTGARAYKNAEVAALVTEVTGRTIELVETSDEILAEHLQQAGVLDPFVRLLVSVEANTRVGLAGLVNDTIERLSARKPQSLREFLVANKAVLAGFVR